MGVNLGNALDFWGETDGIPPSSTLPLDYSTLSSIHQGRVSVHNILAEHTHLTPYPAKDYTQIVARGGAVAARRAHNPKVVGSNPTPATKVKNALCFGFDRLTSSEAELSEQKVSFYRFATSEKLVP